MSFCLIEADDLVVTVAGDLTLKQFDDELIKHCLISGLVAPAEYTIAQILAEDWGHDARQVLGLSLRHRDGSYTKTGGKVIKNVSGYDLSKIYLGTCELFAEIQSANLRVEK
jgi:glycolate oxidase FAD binding subunit